jgi:hypothetical protein
MAEKSGKFTTPCLLILSPRRVYFISNHDLNITKYHEKSLSPRRLFHEYRGAMMRGCKNSAPGRTTMQTLWNM